ncbi:hypothetical protein LTR28_010688 [Elasticomyces elasticus]|nr:hypothetical protein LTR28_010688 [Elasticomyces elasticus]
MEQVPIAELALSLPSQDTKVIKAVVSVIWLYSSSTTKAMVLLAEPDIRLRRDKGQVIVQLFGASAQAFAGFRIRIGDEVLLAPQGVEWLENAGSEKILRGVDWVLVYTHRLVMQQTP